YDHKYNFTQKGRSYALNGPLHFLNLRLLRRFLGPTQKIIHRKFTKLDRKAQDSITREIKIARLLGLISFTF
ncbi:MAG: ribosomal protein S18, partial [bacterium]|nr:ribosomal protein S18 [bacterium]